MTQNQKMCKYGYNLISFLRKEGVQETKVTGAVDIYSMDALVSLESRCYSASHFSPVPHHNGSRLRQLSRVKSGQIRSESEEN